jgi:hypothetical protein
MNVPTHYPKKDVLLIAFFALSIGLAGGYVSKAEADEARAPSPALEASAPKYFQCIDTRSQETVFERDQVVEVANDGGDQWLLQMDDELVSFIQSPGEYCRVRDSRVTTVADAP